MQATEMKRQTMEAFHKGDRIEMLKAEKLERTGTILGFYDHFVLIELDCGFRTTALYHDFISGNIVPEGFVIEEFREGATLAEILGSVPIIPEEGEGSIAREA